MTKLVSTGDHGHNLFCICVSAVSAVCCLTCGSKSWPLKMEHKTIDRTEASMHRWPCDYKLKVRKRNAEIGDQIVGIGSSQFGY